MIKLSAEQISAFEDMEMHRFIARIVDELPGYRPELVAGRSRATLFSASTAAVERAKAYDIETEKGFWLYVNIATTLGGHFDVDPSLPWAHDTLTDASYLSDECVDDLWNTTSDWCAETIGEGEYLPTGAYTRYLDTGSPNIASKADMRADLKELWPERAELCDPLTLDAFITQSGNRGADLGLVDPNAIARLIRISFLIGFGFDADPFHDWSAPVFARGGIDPDLDVAAALDSGFRRHHIEPALEMGL